MQNGHGKVICSFLLILKNPSISISTETDYDYVLLLKQYLQAI